MNFAIREYSYDDLRMYFTSYLTDLETNRKKTLLYGHSIFAGMTENNQLYGGIDVETCSDEIFAA